MNSSRITKVIAGLSIFLSFSAVHAALETVEGSNDICTMKIVSSKRPWKVALTIKKGDAKTLTKTGIVGLVASQPLRTVGYSILRSSETTKSLTIVGSIHDGGVEDGFPRILDSSTVLIGIGNESCTNPTVTYEGN